MKKQNFQPYEPKKCWVGDSHKVCYPDEETAEQSARLSEFEHGLEPGTLGVYKCEYGDHWHLAHKQQKSA